MGLSASTGTVTFSNGQGSAQASIPIQGSGFLKLGSTFSVTLLDVQFLGAGGKVLIISHSYYKILKLLSPSLNTFHVVSVE